MTALTRVCYTWFQQPTTKASAPTKEISMTATPTATKAAATPKAASKTAKAKLDKAQAATDQAVAQRAAVIQSNLVRAEMAADIQLTDEQVERAASTQHDGLAKLALRTWILDGKGIEQQVSEGASANALADAAKAADNATASKPAKAKVEAGIPFKSAYSGGKSTFRTFAVRGADLVDLDIETEGTTNDKAYQARVAKALKARDITGNVDLLTMNTRFTWKATYAAV